MEEEKKTVDPVQEAETPEIAEEAAEKETTVELREEYEAATEETPEKPKKKMTKKKLIIIIVASVLAAAIIGLLLWFFIPSKGKDVGKLDLDPGKPGVSNTINTALQTKLAAAIAPNATQDQQKEAFIELYNLANENKIKAKDCVMIAQGYGEATVGGSMGGGMSVRAFKVQSNGEYYYQKGAKLVKVTAGKASTISKFLDQQERTYCSKDLKTCRTVSFKGTKAGVGSEFDETIPFLSLASRDKKGEGDLYKEFTKNYKYTKLLEETYVSKNGDLKEINNFKYGSTDSISSVKSFTYNEKKGYYEISVVVNVKDEATVDASREYLRKSSKSQDLEYEKYDLTVTIWDNGYIRTFYDEEIWAGNSAIVGSIAEESRSETWYEAAFYWDYDSLVKDGLIAKSDSTITKENFTKDIINKYAKEVEWVQ